MTGLIRGVLPVLHTPLQADETIDRDALAREIDWCFEIGADGVCGAMVSEVLRLTYAERLELTRLMSEMTDGRGVVIASVGAESTRQALVYARQAEEEGCDVVMAIPPVTTAIPEAALWEYFSTIARECALPLIVQDASSYVGNAISIDFYRRLLDEFGAEKIRFKPEASPIGPNLSALRDATEGRALIYDGSGGILLVDAYRRGITGTMPGVDLLDGIITLWNALRAGDERAIYRISFPICALVALQLQAGLDGFLAIEKYLLVKRGIFTSEQRCTPHAWALDEETRAEVDRLFDLLMQALAEA
ncbi:L-2-keto-3-deoxyarabonate dehydratase [Gimesia panareensis]|uniref:L-2-keto-3-deoxyarabonate dehydratase n=1 Tax=Gimesia panareensis TaxID=2527978 RepID=A0A518FKJ2_9PLAN|nr:dihydrodipicolinate synthase family protein [Gimesia panareensis]QDV16868.1 L-2-keto-3-deoxyarabonate dehydratase [Gimesia panareensis]